MLMSEITEQARAELARDLAIGRAAEQRRQDAQRTCEECRDVQADYRDDVEQHLCDDCYLEIETADEDHRLDDPRRGQASGLNR